MLIEQGGYIKVIMSCMPMGSREEVCTQRNCYMTEEIIKCYSFWVMLINDKAHTVKAIVAY